MAVHGVGRPAFGRISTAKRPAGGLFHDALVRVAARPSARSCSRIRCPCRPGVWCRQGSGYSGRGREFGRQRLAAVHV